MPRPSLMLCRLASSAALVLPGLANAADPSPFPVVAGTGNIASVQLISPTTRYDHFVQGRDYEAGGFEVRLASGPTLTLELPEDLVFEDNAPRVGDLDGDGEDEIVVVLSSLREGAAIAVYTIESGKIALRARTDFIGQPHRWRNIAGLGDFDGDGQIDIASVAMPHLVKRLEIHTLEGDRLMRIGEAQGFSNHRLGSVHTGMAIVSDFDGDGIDDIALPDADRAAIRVVSFANRSFREIARLALPAPADGPLTLAPDGGLTVGLETGERVVLPLPRL